MIYILRGVNIILKVYERLIILSRFAHEDNFDRTRRLISFSSDSACLLTDRHNLATCRDAENIAEAKRT